jgi:hypothetical protein
MRAPFSITASQLGRRVLIHSAVSCLKLGAACLSALFQKKPNLHMSLRRKIWTLGPTTRILWRWALKVGRRLPDIAFVRTQDWLADALLFPNGSLIGGEILV